MKSDTARTMRRPDWEARAREACQATPCPGGMQACMHSQPVRSVTKLVCNGKGASPPVCGAGKILGPLSQPGLMATPWKYTGQSVPRAKQAVGTAALEHPARGAKMLTGSRATDPTFGSALPVSPQMKARVVAPICRVLARSSSRCPVILLTAIYYEARKALKAPAAKDLPKDCAIAFVNSPDHYTPGWTNLTTPIFGSDLPRSAHVVKIAAGLKESGNATIVHVDFKELQFHPFDGDCLRQSDQSGHGLCCNTPRFARFANGRRGNYAYYLLDVATRCTLQRFC